MKNWLIRRLLWMVPIIIGISFFAFALTNLSTVDPAEAALRLNQPTAPTEEQIAQMRQELGLDQPFFIRYLNWITDAVQGNFGQSYVNGEEVLSEIGEALPPTLYLAAVTLLIILSVSIGFGITCARYENSLFDRIVRTIVFFGAALPSFWIGILLMWFFAVWLKILPTSGMSTPSSVILPAVTLSFGYIPTYLRLIRNTMIEKKSENYILYMRARGLSESSITRHLFRNSVQTAITALGMSIPKLIAGTVVIENIFAWPGIGRLCVSAIYNRDIPVIQAYVLMMAILFVICNLVVDVLSMMTDPRRRKEDLS